MFEELNDEAGIAAARYNAAFGLGIGGGSRRPSRCCAPAGPCSRSWATGEPSPIRCSAWPSCTGYGAATRWPGKLERRRWPSTRRWVTCSGSLVRCTSWAGLRRSWATWTRAQVRFMETLAIEEAVGEWTGLALSLDALADLEISEGKPRTSHAPGRSLGGHQGRGRRGGPARPDHAPRSARAGQAAHVRAGDPRKPGRRAGA